MKIIAMTVAPEFPPAQRGPSTHVDHSHFDHQPTPGRATLDAAGELLRALSAPLRIGIVLMLRDHACCVHELVEHLDATQPLISQHLRVLKSTGVVRGERDGREVRYRLVNDHLAHIVLDAIAHSQEGPP